MKIGGLKLDNPIMEADFMMLIGKRLGNLPDSMRIARSAGIKSCYYIKFRKRVITAVLMRSANMAPMMGTTMKGLMV